MSYPWALSCKEGTMVRTKVDSVEQAGLFCPLTRGECRSDCALLMEYINVSGFEKSVRRDFICALATKENAYYDPSNRIHIIEKLGE